MLYGVGGGLMRSLACMWGCGFVSGFEFIQKQVILHPGDNEITGRKAQGRAGSWNRWFKAQRCFFRGRAV